MKLMSGNEAIARGAFEAGCLVATGYPGTPSTEILENLSQYKEVYSQWSVNEKVATEVACGASISGVRSLVTMKVVGLNVAMDPIMTMSYLGVNGGLVIIVADDPSCTSSQSEQDNRLIAPFAKIPLIEPSDSQECKDYIKTAFEISEKFNVPVLFRVTTRICHSKSLVSLGEKIDAPVIPYKKTGKYCSSPALACQNHERLEKMLPELSEYSETSPLNRIEWGDKKIGIITSGASYQHAKEVFKDGASYLKLGLTHKIPEKMIKNFCEQVETVYVIEENEPHLENAVRLLGISLIGKDKLPLVKELSPQVIRECLLNEKPNDTVSIDATPPARPPVLCSGCPHRSIFFAVSRYKDVIVSNDIGCYTLGMVPPLSATDTIVCMGGGVSVGIGMEKAFSLTDQRKKVFGFAGDSTFMHSGITGLIDAIWNNSNLTLCILDNSTTAMTGHQPHPGTGKTLMGHTAPIVDIYTVVKAVGVLEEQIFVVDAYDLDEVQSVVKKAYEATGVSVIITKQPCALIKEVQKERSHMKCIIHQDKCKKCKLCLKIGCPSVIIDQNTISIDETDCNGCGMCYATCKFGAIEKVGV